MIRNRKPLPLFILLLLSLVMGCASTNSAVSKSKEAIELRLNSFEAQPNKRFCGKGYRVQATIINNSQTAIKVVLPFQKGIGNCVDSFYPEYFSLSVGQEARPAYIESSVEPPIHFKKEQDLQTIAAGESFDFVVYGHQSSGDQGIIKSSYAGTTTLQLQYQISAAAVEKYQKFANYYANNLPPETIQSLSQLTLVSNELTVIVE